ncbi:probable G-protein coupled receptor Mth-like 1 isoform X1 [Leguminivora glycinivorella]|uniref:probable G-protein coupled receptor Mth-like 1 isoform X1 n=1 Tax=Leguminivora glycinivorella TaxID=1035111 RepID=UPI00200E692C|nr:probable G-protein coupled receptor Mth-like 1 isoform X1 [Leguminivora glycinivorella]
MGLVTCTNFVLWVLTARHCARVKSEVHRLQAGSVGDRAKRRFRVDKAKYILTGKLWVVMGAGWLAEMLSTMTGNPKWLWDIIDRINELQGVFIFIILIMKPKLYYLIRKRLGLEKPDAKNGTSSSGRTSSTFLSRTISTDERTNLRISLPESAKKV